MTDSSYYAASQPTPPLSAVRNATPVAFSRAQLNREQTTSSNLVFVAAVLLYVFILIWGSDLTNTGFYVLSSINILLLATTYWMWTSSRKWFQTPAAMSRKRTTGAS